MIKTSIKTIRLLGLIAAASLLAGCILVPGSNIDPGALGATTNDTSWFESTGGAGKWFPGLRREPAETPEQQQATEQIVQQTVDVVTITSQLVAEQQRQSQLNQAVPAAMPVSLQQELASYEYHVDKGDMLTITVYDHPELTNPSGSNNNNPENSGITVENDGTIYYPYIGKVQVAGLTVDEIREAIARPLAQYITDPQVSVRVQRFSAKRIYVTGQVTRPGQQSITNIPLTVLDAIAAAGGLAADANWHEVMLSRNGTETILSVYEMLNNGRLGQNMLMQHGDVLHVPVAGQQQVFVLGELNRVNTLPMGNIRMSLTEALTRSGGLNQVTSNAEGIFVIRPNAPDAPKLATIYQLDVKNAIAFAVGAQFMLQPADIVYVTTAPVTRWNRVISQIVPSINALITANQLNSL